jgi:hypothetical protein
MSVDHRCEVTRARHPNIANHRTAHLLMAMGIVAHSRRAGKYSWLERRKLFDLLSCGLLISTSDDDRRQLKRAMGYILLPQLSRPA